MKRKPSKSDAEWMKEQLVPFVGATFTLVEVHGTMEWDELVLRLEKDGKMIELIPLRDPEGNGPGWLHIIKY